MRLKLTFGLILLSLAFVGCGSGVELVNSDTSKEVKRDSVTTVKLETKRDTVKIAADSLKITVPLKDLNEVPVIAKSKTGRTQGSVRLVNNTVEVECFTEKYEQIIESQNKIIETLLKITESQNTTNTVKVTESPWYMKALAFLGVAFVLVLVFSLIKPKIL